MSRRLPALLAALLLALALAACGGSDEPAPEGVPPFGSGLDVKALAGPQCPVESIPPDPACAPKPIAVEFVVVDAAGDEVARGTTGAGGETRLLHVDPGTYTLRGIPTGVPPTVRDHAVTVPEGQVVSVVLDVDTGIR